MVAPKLSRGVPFIGAALGLTGAAAQVPAGDVDGVSNAGALKADYGKNYRDGFAATGDGIGHADPGHSGEGGARNSLIRFSRALFPSASASPIVSKECWQRSKTWSPSHSSQRNRV
jgi:hypothetical protein